MHVYPHKIPKINRIEKFTCTYVDLLPILALAFQKTCIIAVELQAFCFLTAQPCSTGQF
ncbi:Uncharacterised protein [Chlamydia abortus]|nr:Uncharacterised protein [Chlamydia abortus]